MAARLRIIGLAWVFTLGFLSGSVAAQKPADISYGSITAAENSLLSAVHFGQPAPIYPAPIYVAQNTPSANISPNTNVPVGNVSASNPASGMLAVLPPFDPYSTSPTLSNVGSVFPTGSLGGRNTSTGNFSETGQLGQTAPSNVYSGNFDKFFPETYEAVRRFREATSFEYTHMPRAGGSNSFGMDEIDLRMQLAFPSRFIPNNGKTGNFYLAPASSIVWWNGPADALAMSPSGFGAFLDFGVQPKFNDIFSLNAWGRFGVFSDFKKVTSDALRYQGRLEGIANLSSQMQLYAGVIYYGRVRVKMLPTVGVVWTPDDNWILRLVFPNPKISRRLWTGAQADWWGYVHMDYGGGSWNISEVGSTDYNDVRLGAGIEFATQSRLGGYFEFGGSFDRELYTTDNTSGGRWASPPSVIYLKTGIIF